jgi:RNA polymerase sigma factor (sigma-70 family)
MKEQKIDLLYKEHVNDLFSYAMSLGFDRETSMDAIHDVFYKICLTKDALGNVKNVRFYLLRMLKNRLLDLYKSKKRRPDISLNTAAEEIPFCIHITIEDEFIEHEEQEKNRLKVEQLLISLTDRQREIIYLRYMQGCDYEAISQIMCITIPACRKLFHKVLTKLRKDVLSLFF